MINGYYYNQQLKKALIVFANIFTNLKVRTGLNACGEIEEIIVPIHYGAGDRVAAAIATGNTQNRLHSLPIMSCYMTGIDLAPERKHGHGIVDRKSYLEQGGVFPNDVKFIRRIVPTPYNLSFDLSIYTSNTDQAYQILEQLMIIFDYELQVQFNDSPFDWAKITRVIMQSISNEENFPLGTDKRMIIWTIPFIFETWITPPAEVRHDLITGINTCFANMGSYQMQEIDENGDLVAFAQEDKIFCSIITEPTNIIDDHDVPETYVSDTYNPLTDIECHIQPPSN